jgi:hypothetical protein
MVQKRKKTVKKKVAKKVVKKKKVVGVKKAPKRGVGSARVKYFIRDKIGVPDFVLGIRYDPSSRELYLVGSRRFREDMVLVLDMFISREARGRFNHAWAVIGNKIRARYPVDARAWKGGLKKLRGKYSVTSTKSFGGLA